MKNLFYCLDCDFEFTSPAWDGGASICPGCGSTRWYDIHEEVEERQTSRRRLPNEESPFS